MLTHETQYKEDAMEVLADMINLTEYNMLGNQNYYIIDVNARKCNVNFHYDLIGPN